VLLGFAFVRDDIMMSRAGSIAPSGEDTGTGAEYQWRDREKGQGSLLCVAAL
jgi:hypothetical protein